MSAAIVTLVVEFSGLALDKAGLSEERAKVARAFIRAVLSTGTGLLIDNIFSGRQVDALDASETTIRSSGRGLQ